MTATAESTLRVGGDRKKMNPVEPWSQAFMNYNKINTRYWNVIYFFYCNTSFGQVWIQLPPHSSNKWLNISTHKDWLHYLYPMSQKLKDLFKNILIETQLFNCRYQDIWEEDKTWRDSGVSLLPASHTLSLPPSLPSIFLLSSPSLSFSLTLLPFPLSFLLIFLEKTRLATGNIWITTILLIIKIIILFIINSMSPLFKQHNSLFPHFCNINTGKNK